MNLRYLSILLVILLFISLVFNLKSCKSSSTPVEVITHDTITVSRDVIKTKEVVNYVTTFDTIIEHRTDSIVDTVYITLPIEHKTFSDSICNDSVRINYGAKYSGFKSSLDSVWIDYTLYNRSALKSKKKWTKTVCFGLVVDYGIGITPNGGVVYVPTIGVGGCIGIGREL